MTGRLLAPPQTLISAPRGWAASLMGPGGVLDFRTITGRTPGHAWDRWGFERPMAAISRSNNLPAIPKRETSTGFARSHILAASPWRSPEAFGNLCKNETSSCSFSWKTVFSRLFLYISVENRSPYSVPRCSLNLCRCHFRSFLAAWFLYYASVPCQIIHFKKPFYNPFIGLSIQMFNILF